MTDKKDTSKKDVQIDTLKWEVSDIGKLLEDLSNELKNNEKLPEEEKKAKNDALKAKVDTIKAQAETVKKKIEAKISALSDKTDDDSVKEKEQAETLLTSLNETITLQASILNTWSTSTAETTTDDEKKWFFWRVWDWLWDQWGKAKENPWKYILWVTWLAVAWVAIKKAWNRLSWKKKKKKTDWESESSESKEEKKEKKDWWFKKFLIRAWLTAWAVVWWVEIYKNWNRITSWVKEKLWLALGFDEALVKVENEVKNWKVDTEDFWTFRAHFEWMSYDETTQQICSFWEWTKINKDKKTIEWMDVQFASREELFHAVNIVNFAKRELAWRWATENPFTKNSTSWDIDFNVSEGWNSGFMSANWSDFWTKALWLAWAWTGWLLWWYFLWVKWALVWWVWVWLAWYTLWSIIDNTSTMWRACNTIAKGANLDKFVNYLNGLNVRKGKPQEKEPDEASPIHPYLNQVIDEIESELWPKQKRDLSVEYDENNPSEITIKSYHQTIKLKLEWNTAKKWENLDFTKITKISFLKYDNNDRWDGLDIDFPHTDEWIKEAIRTANLTNMLRSKFKNNWSIRYPFWYWRYSTPMTFDITNRLWGYHWTSLLEPETLEKKYPTIHKDLKKTPRFLGLPTLWSQFWTKSDQKKQHEQALNDSSEWSQYIKYLNQMWCWEYRWKKSSTN